MQRPPSTGARRPQVCYLHSYLKYCQSPFLRQFPAERRASCDAEHPGRSPFPDHTAVRTITQCNYPFTSEILQCAVAYI